MIGWLAAAALVASAAAQAPAAQPAPAAATPPRFDGRVAVVALLAGYPRLDTAELRARAGIELTVRPARAARFHVDVMADGLAADRFGSAVRDGAVHVREAWADLTMGRVEVRAGAGRLAWGRLDEIQPSDVINPLDAARFFLDGRSDARLSVPIVRGRVFASDRLSVEGVLAPVFRRARFDELDEPTSPFNLTRDLVLPAIFALASSDIVRLTPERAWRNVSGGARVTGTIGRVDVSGSVYRGFEGFGVLTFEPLVGPAPVPLVVGHLVERFPRFTMTAGDFEAVAGEWAWRGEMAAFTEKSFAGMSQPGMVAGHAIDAGVGVDRPAGDFHVFASAVVHRQWSAADPLIERTDLNLVGSIERAIGRDRWRVRGFAVLNPAGGSGFVRGLVVWRVRDDVTIEGSAGAFIGTGVDPVARFHGRDFVFIRLRVGTSVK